MTNAKPGDDAYSPIRSESPLLQPVASKIIAMALVNALAGEMLVWKDEYLTEKDAAKTAVDLNKIEVPFYALYGAGTTVCPAEKNKEQLEGVGAVKRSITYDGFDGGAPTDSVDLWKSPTKISVDMVTILGSGAHALVAATAALTLLSTV